MEATMYVPLKKKFLLRRNVQAVKCKDLKKKKKAKILSGQFSEF